MGNEKRKRNKITAAPGCEKLVALIWGAITVSKDNVGMICKGAGVSYSTFMLRKRDPMSFKVRELVKLSKILGIKPSEILDAIPFEKDGVT